MQFARKKARAVLYLEFHPESRDARRAYRFDEDPTRRSVLAWLDAHGVKWQECGPYANPNRMASYLGQVYLDVPYDETLAEYCLLRDYLEWPNGTIRHAGIRFFVLPLDHAMCNAAHDEPGFWERWAEDF